MRMKIDFVTNSSSTAYVVFIPNQFKANREMAERIYSHNTMDEDSEFGDTVFADIEESFETLKSGEYLWQYGDEGTPGSVYYAVLEICNRNGLVVSSSEFGGEGNNSIFGVKEEQVVDILKNYINLNQIVNQANEGVKLCYEPEKDSR